MGEGYRLSVVLPAFNEEDNVVEAVTRASEVARRLCAEHELIVVDDGSSDRTAALVEGMAASDPGIRLVRHERNLGYGEAVRSGLRAARLDLVFLTDADNQFDLNELETFLPWSDRVDVVAGYRVNHGDPVHRRLLRRAWNYLVRALFYVPVRDIDCAFKLFRRHVFEDIDLQSVGAMVSTEMMVKLGRSGLGVVEVGVTHCPRTAGQARGASPRVIARALYELLRMYRRLQRAGPVSSPAALPTEPTRVR
jgi:glycosyltransferase involved in cell wall biosynthesis